MAWVYRVRHATLHTRHALKILKDDSTQLRLRLEREGRLQARLVHPHLVPVTDLLVVEGHPALLMPFVDGPDLGSVLRRQRPTHDVAGAIIRGILAGVGHAHAHGVVHRDLKPANVLLERVGDGFVPRVTDFGIARIFDAQRHGAAATPLTCSAQFLGTPAYASPEQFDGARDVDHRADVFSLGVMLYELYTGERPFVGEGLIEVQAAILGAEYLDPAVLVPDLDPRITRAIRA